jgi:hypothetical protein
LNLTNGSNFFTITGSELTSVVLSATAFTDLRQVRFSALEQVRQPDGNPSGDPVAATPEPATLGMFATGFGVILLGIRRKRS